MVLTAYEDKDKKDKKVRDKTPIGGKLKWWQKKKKADSKGDLKGKGTDDTAAQPNSSGASSSRVNPTQQVTSQAQHQGHWVKDQRGSWSDKSHAPKRAASHSGSMPKPTSVHASDAQKADNFRSAQERFARSRTPQPTKPHPTSASNPRTVRIEPDNTASERGRQANRDVSSRTRNPSSAASTLVDTRSDRASSTSDKPKSARPQRPLPKCVIKRALSEPPVKLVSAWQETKTTTIAMELFRRLPIDYLDPPPHSLPTKPRSVLEATCSEDGSVRLHPLRRKQSAPPGPTTPKAKPPGPPHSPQSSKSSINDDEFPDFDDDVEMGQHANTQEDKHVTWARTQETILTPALAETIRSTPIDIDQLGEESRCAYCISKPSLAGDTMYYISALQTGLGTYHHCDRPACLYYESIATHDKEPSLSNGESNPKHLQQVVVKAPIVIADAQNKLHVHQNQKDANMTIYVTHVLPRSIPRNVLTDNDTALEAVHKFMQVVNQAQPHNLARRIVIPPFNPHEDDDSATITTRAGIERMIHHIASQVLSTMEQAFQDTRASHPAHDDRNHLYAVYKCDPIEGVNADDMEQISLKKYAHAVLVVTIGQAAIAYALAEKAYRELLKMLLPLLHVQDELLAVARDHTQPMYARINIKCVREDTPVPAKDLEFAEDRCPVFQAPRPLATNNDRHTAFQALQPIDPHPTVNVVSKHVTGETQATEQLARHGGNTMVQNWTVTINVTQALNDDLVKQGHSPLPGDGQTQYKLYMPTGQQIPLMLIEQPKPLPKQLRQVYPANAGPEERRAITWYHAEAVIRDMAVTDDEAMALLTTLMDHEELKLEDDDDMFHPETERHDKHAYNELKAVSYFMARMGWAEAFDELHLHTVGAPRKARREYRLMLNEILKVAGVDTTLLPNVFVKTVTDNTSMATQRFFLQPKERAPINQYAVPIQGPQPTTTEDPFAETCEPDYNICNQFNPVVDPDTVWHTCHEMVQPYALSNNIERTAIGCNRYHLQPKSKARKQYAPVLPANRDEDDQVGHVTFIDELTPEFLQSKYTQDGLLLLLVETQEHDQPINSALSAVVTAARGHNDMCVRHIVNKSCPPVPVKIPNTDYTVPVRVCGKDHSSPNNPIQAEINKRAALINDDGTSQFACPNIKCTAMKCTWQASVKHTQQRKTAAGSMAKDHGPYLCSAFSKGDCRVAECHLAHIPSDGASNPIPNSQLTLAQQVLPRPECQLNLLGLCPLTPDQCRATHTDSIVEKQRANWRARALRKEIHSKMDKAMEVAEREHFHKWVSDPKEILASKYEPHELTVVGLVRINRATVDDQYGIITDTSVDALNPLQVLAALAKYSEWEDTQPIAYTDRYPENDGVPCSLSEHHATAVRDAFGMCNVNMVPSECIEHIKPNSDDELPQPSNTPVTLAPTEPVGPPENRSSSSASTKQPNISIGNFTKGVRIAWVNKRGNLSNETVARYGLIQQPKHLSNVIRNDGINHVEWQILCARCLKYVPNHPWLCINCEVVTVGNKLSQYYAEECDECTSKGRGRLLTLLRKCGRNHGDICLHPSCSKYMGRVPGEMYHIAPHELINAIQQSKGSLWDTQKLLGVPAVGPNAAYPTTMRGYKASDDIPYVQGEPTCQSYDWRCMACGLHNHKHATTCPRCEQQPIHTYPVLYSPPDAKVPTAGMPCEAYAVGRTDTTVLVRYKPGTTRAQQVYQVLLLQPKSNRDQLILPNCVLKNIPTQDAAGSANALRPQASREAFLDKVRQSTGYNLNGNIHPIREEYARDEKPTATTANVLCTHFVFVVAYPAEQPTAPIWAHQPNPPEAELHWVTPSEITQSPGTYIRHDQEISTVGEVHRAIKLVTDIANEAMRLLATHQSVTTPLGKFTAENLNSTITGAPPIVAKSKTAPPISKAASHGSKQGPIGGHTAPPPPKSPKPTQPTQPTQANNQGQAYKAAPPAKPPPPLPNEDGDAHVPPPKVRPAQPKDSNDGKRPAADLQPTQPKLQKTTNDSKASSNADARTTNHSWHRPADNFAAQPKANVATDDDKSYRRRWPGDAPTRKAGEDVPQPRDIPVQEEPPPVYIPPDYTRLIGRHYSTIIAQAVKVRKKPIYVRNAYNMYNNVYDENTYGYMLPLSIHIDPSNGSLRTHEWWHEVAHYIAKYLGDNFEVVAQQHGYEDGSFAIKWVATASRSTFIHILALRQWLGYAPIVNELTLAEPWEGNKNECICARPRFGCQGITYNEAKLGQGTLPINCSLTAIGTQQPKTDDRMEWLHALLVTGQHSPDGKWVSRPPSTASVQRVVTSWETLITDKLSNGTQLTATQIHVVRSWQVTQLEPYREAINNYVALFEAEEASKIELESEDDRRCTRHHAANECVAIIYNPDPACNPLRCHHNRPQTADLHCTSQGLKHLKKGKARIRCPKDTYDVLGLASKGTWANNDLLQPKMTSIKSCHLRVDWSLAHDHEWARQCTCRSSKGKGGGKGKGKPDACIRSYRTRGCLTSVDVSATALSLRNPETWLACSRCSRSTSFRRPSFFFWPDPNHTPHKKQAADRNKHHPYAGKRIGEAGNPGPRNRAKPRLPKGQRPQQSTTTKIATYNGNCAETAIKWINQTDVAIHAIQEVKLRNHPYWRTVARIGQASRNMVGTQAILGPNGGLSSGTAIVVDKQLDITEPTVRQTAPGQEHLRYEIVPGRASAIIINNWNKTRLLVVSLYLDVNDGLGETNLAILYEVGDWVAQMGLPYVICGDFNNCPADIQATHWIRAIDGVVVAPSGPTHWATTQEEGTVIDFFVVKAWMAPFAYAETQNRKPTPHMPVILTINKISTGLHEYTVQKPTAFPTEIKATVPNQQAAKPNWDYNAYAANMVQNVQTAPTLEQHAAFVARALETELIAKMGLEHTDEDLQSQYRGRDLMPVVKKTKVAPSGKIKGPSTDPYHESLAHVGHLTSQLANLIAKQIGRRRQRQLNNHDTAHRINTAELLLTTLDQHLEAYEVEDGNPIHRIYHTAHMVTVDATGEPNPNHASYLMIAAKAVEPLVKQAQQQSANQRAKNYRDFIKEAATQNGARILHKLAKLPKPSSPIQVCTQQGKTTADQANADMQREKWKKVWNGSDTQPSNQVIPLEVVHDDIYPTKKEINRFRAIAKSFKRHTAMSFDNLKPHLVGELDDESIAEIIRLFKRAENLGRWPEQWRLAIMVMLPKPKHGEWRLIAMLGTMYRIWARQAGKAISYWMATLDREWLAFGPKKAAEDAAYQVALDMESNDGIAKDWTATILSDLEKGFEKVKHAHLITAAKVVNFPMHILRMALDMYTAPRRIRCGAAVCKPVWTTMGVLAGCPIAMGALCLAVIKPMDLLMREVPRAVTSIKVYVDDFTVTHKMSSDASPYEAAYQLQSIVDRLHALLAEVDLYCSPDKNQVLANSLEYQQIAQHALSKWQYIGVDSTKLLGVDFAGGENVDYEHANKRLDKAVDTVKRMKVYDIKGVNITNAARAHTAGATQYGIMTTGMPDHILAQATRTLRSTTSTVAQGGSATADLLTQKARYLHPAYAAHTNPLTKWSMQIYAKNTAAIMSTRDVSLANSINVKMKQAFNTQFDTVANAENPWKHVKGPAAAMIATLLRIRWFPADYDKWITDCGEIIDLNNCIPYMVTEKVRGAVDRMLWENASINPCQDATQRQNIPIWKLARKVILGKDRLCGAMARSVVINTQWSQSRINPSDPICRACNQHTGNLIHRQLPGPWLCPVSHAIVHSHLSLKAIERLRNGMGGRLFAQHALLTHADMPALTPISRQAAKWMRDEGPKFLTGNIYTDGTTTINHVFPSARRSGYAAVMVEDELPVSDTEEGNPVDEQYIPEAEQQHDQLGQPIINEPAQHCESVTITHNARQWPYQIATDKAVEQWKSRATRITRIVDPELLRKGVNTKWRILSINDEDAFERPASIIARLTDAGRSNPYVKVTSVLIPPTRVTEEIAQRCHCTCPNACNPWHSCVKYCADTYGCDRGCKRKVKQHGPAEKPVTIEQAIYGPLNGEHQSTPRAELEAIACALEHARPPVCIVTDHINHRDTFRKGRRHCCRLGNPMVDIWIRVWAQVDRLGAKNVKMRWFPSHQFWMDGESWQRRVDRRANAAADLMADRGRAVHDVPRHIQTEYNQIETTAIEYHKWTAYLAAAQHNGDIVPDHDKPTANRGRRAKRYICNPSNDQKVLNRMPFAKRSGGIAAEHGPHGRPQQLVGAANQHTQQQTAAARIARICHRKGISTASTSLNIAFEADKETHSTSVNKKGLDLSLFTDHVPPSESNGHNMWVGGDNSNPWVWCVNCGAYSNKVVKKLATKCSAKGNMTAVNLLMQGYHPTNPKEKQMAKRSAPSDVSTLARYFAQPAATDTDRNMVLHAVVRTHNPKDKRLGNKWQSIMQRANVRIARHLRFSNPAQTKKRHDETNVSQTAPMPNRPLLTNQPRRLVWADIGGRPASGETTTALRRATAIQAAKAVCTAAYASAYRKHRKQQLISQGAIHNRNAATHSTDSITGIATINNRRRRFVIPDPKRNSTPNEVQNMFLLRAHSQIANNEDPDPHADIQAEQLPPSFDDEDVFGHGGGLD